MCICFSEEDVAERPCRKGSAGGDTYVDPMWRRKGIAEALHRASSKGMRKKGVMLQYGFPLRENLKAKCKAGACLPGDFVSARCLLSVRPFLKKVRMDRFLPRKLLEVLDSVFLKVTNPGIFSSTETEYEVRKIETFDERFEALSRSLALLSEYAAYGTHRTCVGAFSTTLSENTYCWR